MKFFKLLFPTLLSLSSIALAVNPAQAGRVISREEIETSGKLNQIAKKCGFSITQRDEFGNTTIINGNGIDISRNYDGDKVRASTTDQIGSNKCLKGFGPISKDEYNWTTHIFFQKVMRNY